VIKLWILASLAAPVHSWYPGECCSQRDCELAIGTQRDEQRREWVMPNGERVRYEEARATPPGVQGIHWCRSTVTLRIIRMGRPCVFVPESGG